MEYEFYQVGYKRFKSENPDGTGQIQVLEEKTVCDPVSDSDSGSIITRDMFRNLKAGMNEKVKKDKADKIKKEQKDKAEKIK